MHPAVVTFYSYKGGVGRTLLAANTAAALAKQGKTLLWDLDVEAPGLHRIADLRPVGAVKRGFLAWLGDWQDRQDRHDQEEQQPKPAAGGKRRRSVSSAPDWKSLDRAIYESRIAQLDVLPAHGDDDNPVLLYSHVDWARWFQYEVDSALTLLRAVLAHLHHDMGYQHVVIDARTGLTDLSALLVGVLADVAVLVGGYGEQSLSGLAHVWRGLHKPGEAMKRMRQQRPGPEIVLVASPIPKPEDTELLVQRQKRWLATFEVDPQALLEIPYDDRLPFTDRLLIDEAQSRLYEPYRRVARTVSDIFDRLAAEAEAERLGQAQRPDIFGSADERNLSLAAAQLTLTGFAPTVTQFGLRALRPPRFEVEVAQLLRLLGYEVEVESQVDGRNVDLLARLKLGLEQRCYLVECKDQTGPVASAAVQVMHDQLQQPMARQWRASGMLVARAGFSAAALELAQRHGLLALTPQALEQQLIDFGPYLDRLIRDFEKTALFTAYVTQRAQPGAGDSSSEQPEATLDDLLAHGSAWASGAGQRLWVLLGDYGTGKSAFVARLNYALATAARADAAAPVPLAVNLRDIPNKSRLDDVLAEQWLRSTGQRLDPALLLYLLRRGRLVLLFDAFDEMGIASAGRPVVEQFRMLVGPSADGGDGESAARANRVLVTCREQFFKEHGEVQRVTEGERVSALQGVALGLGGRIDRLLPFSAEQVQQFLTLRLGEAEARKASDFMQQHGLADLGDRPQLLEVIIASLPALQAQGGAVSAGALYRAYTDRWLDDFKPAERQSSSAQLRQVLGVLAGLLWAREGNRMHYGDLYAMLRERPQLCEGLDPNQLDVELRTAAFLSRTPDGHYGFSHRSFLEFFLARRIDLSAQAQPPNQDLARLLDIPLLSTEVCGFVADLCVEDQRDALGTALKGVLAGATAAASKTSRINALWLGYRLALRDAATADRTAQACARYLPEAADLSACDLSGMALPGLALPGALLLGANLQGCALDQVRWAGADLRGSDLRNSTLFDADLRGAKLDEAIGNGCDLSLADMTHASARRSHWCGAMFMYARLAGTDFSGADLRGARLAAAKGAPMLDDALLAGATARDTGAVWPIALREPRPRALTAAAHAGGGASLAYSPDGTRLASASRDGVIRLWDASTGLAVAAWDGGGGIVHSVAFSPDGRQLASAAHDGLIRVWDTDSGAMTLTMSGHIGAVRSVMFSPTGQQLASAGQDGSVRLWSLADASFACFSGVHSGGVLSAVFSPHGQLLASIGRDEQVRLWKIPGGDLISTITRTPGWADASALAFSPDGLRLLTGSISGAQVWSVDTGKTLLTVGSATQITFAVAFSPSGKLFATGGSSEVRLWDAESGHAVGVLKSGGGWAGAMEFSPDGRQLAAATSAGDINVWDLAGARPAWHLQRWVAAVRSVAFGPDGLTLVSAGQDGSIRSWRADLGHLAASRVAHPEGITCIAFAPDGGCMASAGNDGTIKLWKRGAELPVATLRSEAVPIMNVMFSPDGSHLASVDGRSGLKVWDVSRGRVAMQIDADQSRAFDVGYSADGSRLASAGVSGVVRLWDVATGQEASKLSGNRGPVYSVAFSPDGRYMAVGGFDGWLRLFDADSEAQIGQFDGHDVAVLRVRFSPNGRYLASAGWDGRIRLWDVASCQLEATLTGHDGCVHSIAFSPDGKRLVSGGDDGIVRLWDVASARLLRWAHAADDGWYSVDLEADPRGLWRGEGLALRRLVYHDTSETMQPWPWVARRWCAEDVPELKAPDGPLSLAAAATPARKPRRAKARTG